MCAEALYCVSPTIRVALTELLGQYLTSGRLVVSSIRALNWCFLRDALLLLFRDVWLEESGSCPKELCFSKLSIFLFYCFLSRENWLMLWWPSVIKLFLGKSSFWGQKGVCDPSLRTWISVDKVWDMWGHKETRETVHHVIPGVVRQ